MTEVDHAPAERGRLRTVARLMVALLAGAFWASGADAALQSWNGPPEAPALELKTLDGRPLALSDLRGKVVVVNFWATWCEPCVDEMPSMQRLREALATEDFEILAVNLREGEPRIRSFLAKVPVTFPIVRDADGEVARAWKVRIFPSSFVIDRHGAVRYFLIGTANWDAPEIETILRALLRTPRAATTAR